MRKLSLFVLVLISLFLAMPAAALECANRVGGTAASTAPDDTDDGDATACGSGTTAGGDDSIALGYFATSPGAYSTALSYSASSGGERSAALGFDASSAGLNSIALGAFASSPGDWSIALGNESSSAGHVSTALGVTASSPGGWSTALGYEASSTGSNSTALGYSASSGGERSIALGWDASSAGHWSTALGRLASSAGEHSTALGYHASSAGAQSTALGWDASSPGTQSTALGFRAFADQPETVIIGAIAGVNAATTYARVGIGTTAPSEAVDVQRSAAAARFQVTSFTDTASEAPQYIQRRARGTSAAPAAVQNGDNLGLFSFRGYNGATMGGSRATITAQAAGTFTGASNPTRLIFSTTPVGQTTPQSVLVITPDGKVQVNGQNLTVPDYVFEDDYPLMPLDELQTFIDENGHLPGIAPAHEVREEGLDLAGSQMGLLQKVEELTLYTLQLQSQMKAQQEEIDQLKGLLTRPLVANN